MMPEQVDNLEALDEMENHNPPGLYKEEQLLVKTRQTIEMR